MVTEASSIVALLHQAVAHHQAGRLDAAEALYSKVIAADPRNADALNLMGAIAHHHNQLDRARGLFERAIACGPDIAEIHFNLGNLLSVAQDVDGARSAYRRAVALKPGFADAHLNLGVLLYKADRHEEAVASFRNVVTIAPSEPRGHFNLGQSLLQLSQLEDAEASLKRAVELAPDYLDAHLALATHYDKTGKLEDAITHTRRAIALNPLPEYYSNLGDLLRRAGDLEAALAALRTALADKPDEPIILHNYCAVLHADRQLDEAQQVYHRLLALDPHFIHAYIGLAKVYESQELYDDAVTTLERGLALDPDSPDLLFKMSWLHLATGDLKKGWREYEFRSSCTTVKAQAKRSSPPAFWTGEDLRGKTILVWTEQGLGEEILFSSMIPDIAARAGRCIVECSPRMVPIFARSFPHVEVVGYRNSNIATTPAGEVDYQIAAPSLGRFFRPDIDQFPRHRGYLKADPVRTAALRARYQARAQGRLIVGLSWRSQNEGIGKIKSTDLATWTEVLTTPGVSFVNLQYGDCTAELAAVKQSLGVDVFQDLEIDPLKSMDDFFSQVAAMDLVISTSNTTVHAAGALNIPTWLFVLNGPISMWYWFLNRENSPWYPSLRILRYQGLKLTESWWRSAVARVGQELRAKLQIRSD
jgi:tetratricopeptide (TPR) repeat protein